MSREQQNAPRVHGLTVRQLVRVINARRGYTYFSTPAERFRVVSARVQKGEFQVRGLYDHDWFTCDPSEIDVEGC